MMMRKTTIGTIAMLLAAIQASAAPGGDKTPLPLSDEQIEQRIAAHRTAEVVLTVTDSAGKPLKNTSITVGQVSHKFLFGANAFKTGQFSEAKLNAAYKQRFVELLNFGTLPFYLGAYERRQGRTRQDSLTTMARWCRQGDITAKGHPLCWHEVVPKWLEGKSPAEVEKLQLGRIARDVKAFAGLIDTWDVVNESVVMPNHKNAIGRLCKNLGRTELLKRTFATARKANPKATLILNDFDTSRRFEQVIADCIKSGVDFDVIGIQSHMHKRYWGARRAWDVCRRFAKFKKPLHFTELTILSGPLKTDNDWHKRRTDWHTSAEGEKRQAEQAVEFYRVLYSHPAVEAITWWDFSDNGAWQGAPAGLVRKDMSPKGAYQALKKLIKGKWWTGEMKLTTDTQGRVRFRGTLGQYSAAVTPGKVAGVFSLTKSGKATLAVKTRRQ